MSLLNKLKKYRKNKIIKNFDAAVNHVKHGIYHCVKNDLSKKHDEEFSGLMAASVVNEIFGLPATTQEAANFTKKNQKAIESEIRNLGTKKEVIKILNICLRLRAKIIYENISSGATLKISGKAIDNLKKYNLLLPDIELPSTTKFIRDARSFHKREMKFIW